MLVISDRNSLIKNCVHAVISCLFQIQHQNLRTFSESDIETAMLPQRLTTSSESRFGRLWVSQSPIVRRQFCKDSASKWSPLTKRKHLVIQINYYRQIKERHIRKELVSTWNHKGHIFFCDSGTTDTVGWLDRLGVWAKGVDMHANRIAQNHHNAYTM